MNKLLTLTACLLISGCAITPQQARQKSSFELCEMAFWGMGTDRHKATIGNELAYRQYDCRQDHAAIIAKRQAKAAADAALFQSLVGASALINATQPQVPAPPQTIIIEQQRPLPPVNIPSCHPFCR